MTEIDGVTFEEIEKKWNDFKEIRKKKPDRMCQSHISFITMIQREKIIDDLISHYKFLQQEYEKLLVNDD